MFKELKENEMNKEYQNLLECKNTDLFSLEEIFKLDKEDLKHMVFELIEHSTPETKT
jgi:succinate dehydrogenase flavin-adding protein (antitoxin of CptAB toxin-antitoxin module)